MRRVSRSATARDGAWRVLIAPRVPRVEIDPGAARALSRDEVLAVERESDRLASARDRAIMQVLLRTEVPVVTAQLLLEPHRSDSSRPRGPAARETRQPPRSTSAGAPAPDAPPARTPHSAHRRERATFTPPASASASAPAAAAPSSLLAGNGPSPATPYEPIRTSLGQDSSQASAPGTLPHSSQAPAA
jgi:hypothetical protein